MKITFILLVSQHPAHIRTLSHHYQSKYHLSAAKAVISNLQGFLLPSCCAQQVQLRWVKKKNQHKVWIFGQKVSFRSPCADSAPPHYKDETRPDLFLKHKTWCTQQQEERDILSLSDSANTCQQESRAGTMGSGNTDPAASFSLSNQNMEVKQRTEASETSHLKPPQHTWISPLFFFPQ